VRCGLAQIGINPARAVMLRVADEAAVELAAMCDTQELREADRQVPQHDGDAPPDDDAWLDEATRGLVERYRSGVLPEPDLAQGSLGELFALCLARHDGAGSTSVSHSSFSPKRLPLFVMAGLDPAIHVYPRVKPRTRPGMTNCG
jgi:hypothetical protein